MFYSNSTKQNNNIDSWPVSWAFLFISAAVYWVSELNSHVSHEQHELGSTPSMDKLQLCCKCVTPPGTFGGFWKREQT